MKQIIYGGIKLFITVLFLALIATIGAGYLRNREVMELTSAALYGTAKAAWIDDSFETLSTEDITNQFLDSLSYSADDDTKLHVEVLALDESKGLMSVAVTESFTYPNGKKGNKEAVRTVIVDEEKEPEVKMYTLSFYERIQKAHGTEDRLLSTYLLPEKSLCVLPQFPEKSGYTLMQICYKDGTAVYKEKNMNKDDAVFITDEKGRKLEISKDMEVYGIYKKD